jgi:hypothetical protein
LPSQKNSLPFIAMKNETTTTIDTLFRYELKAPWIDPQGFKHEPHELKMELIAGGIFHPKFIATEGKLQTQPTRHNPAFVVPAEFVKITKITVTQEIKTTTEEQIVTL